MLNDFLRFVPDAWHRDYLSLLANIPGYIHTIAVVGLAAPAIGRMLKKRPELTVLGVSRDARSAAMSSQLLDGVIREASEAEQLPEASLDALLLLNLETDLEEAIQWLQVLSPKLHDFGHVYVLHGAAEKALAGPGDDLGATADYVAGELRQSKYHVYKQWAAGQPPVGLLAMAIPETYNPAAHAQQLAETGDFDGAYGILDAIPGVYLEEDATCESIWLLKLDFLAGRMGQLRGQGVSHLLSRMQDLHYSLTDQFPRNPGSYQRTAHCWELAGDARMAQRVLDSYLYVVDDPEIASARQHIVAPEASVVLSVEAPPWPRKSDFRVLYLIHPRPHFGLDALFDGLCTCLGDEYVTDYPWKPTLHGQESDTMRNYPCRFRRPGVQQSLADIVAALDAGAFDAILYGDVEGELPGEDIRAILGARGACPIFLLDELDQLCDYREFARERLGIAGFAAYFKREMLACVDYGPECYPLPFAYTLPAEPPAPPDTRTNPFFWAGHRMFGQRRLCLEMLEQRYGWDLDLRFEQDAYQKRVQDSLIGLNCFGMGFDTVRYWELPAHGCMLLSDRLPIYVPHNFEDGKQAVFFDDLSDLIDKLDYYLAHPEEAGRIAQAGYAHYCAFHTNEARARQMLGWMSKHL